MVTISTGTSYRRGRSASRTDSWAGCHREGARPIDYEPAGGLSLRSAHEAISGALPQPLAGAADRLGVVAPRAATMAKASRRLLRPELARVNSGLLSLQMKVASIPALIHVIRTLGVDADYVVFGSSMMGQTRTRSGS